MNTTSATQSSSAKFWASFLLSLFLGVFAAHRFYLKSPRRVLMRCTFGGLGVWALIDTVRILLGKFRDEAGVVITNPKPVVSWIIFAVVVVISMASNGNGGISGEYVPVQPDPGMGFETLEIHAGSLAYVGMVDSSSSVAHRGIFKVLSSTPEKTEFACTDAVITLTIGGTQKEMRGDFTGVVTTANGETRLRYGYRNLTSGTGLPEFKEFKKK